MEGYGDKLKFIREKKNEIDPVWDKTQEGKEVTEAFREECVDREAIDKGLELFETKVYSYENPEADPDAKNVMVAFSDAGSYAAVGPILKRIEADPRFRGIIVLEHGVSQSSFAADAGGLYRRTDQAKDVLADIATATQALPPEIAIATLSSENGPENILLYNAKSVFGAKRLYLVVDGWGSGSIPTEHLDKIDGVFCNDELSKRMLQRMLVGFPPEKIYPIGTPQLDGLQIERAEEFEKKGREKLGVGDDAVVCLYAGVVQKIWKDSYGTEPQLEEHTLGEVVRAMSAVASSRPQEQFILLARPHPSDDEKESIYMNGYADLPANLKVVRDPGLDFNEAAYAADAILSLGSSLVWTAGLRGKQGIILDPSQGEQGKKSLDAVYGAEIAAIIRNTFGADAAGSEAELEAALMKTKHTDGQRKPFLGDATGRIIDVIVSAEIS